MTMMWVECVKRNGEIGRMPLDVTNVDVKDLLDPIELRGKFVFIETGRVRAAVCGDQGPFFVSHHSTCPDVDQFRGGR